jgi:5-methylcytosine-specific restriction endonuclease McrA
MGKWDIKERVCKFCGKVFIGAAYKMGFCSNECHLEYRKLHAPVEKECVICGSVFTINAALKDKRFTCSKVCGGKFRTKPKNACEVCGKECVTGKIYCSVACRIVGQRKKRIISVCAVCGGEKSLKATICKNCYIKSYKKSIKCKQCGIEFSGGGERKFCSAECSSNYFKEKLKVSKPVRKCLRCGLEFEIKSSNVSQKYCGVECSIKSMIETCSNMPKNKKKKYHKWGRKKLSPKVRFEVLERDGFKCVYCGCGHPDVKLEVDHVYPISRLSIDREYNNPINLCVCCDVCNSGKSDKKLEKLPASISERLRAFIIDSGFDGITQ